MSLTKKEAAIQSARRAAVIAEITQRGALTGKELMAAVPLLGRGILPSMIKAKLLQSKYSGQNDENGNRIMLYALPGGECKRVEVDPGPSVWNLWPFPLPVPEGLVTRWNRLEA